MPEQIMIIEGAEHLMIEETVLEVLNGFSGSKVIVSEQAQIVIKNHSSQSLVFLGV
jgi:hypothetical protein